MTLDWSFSTDRRMRRCPRQLFLADVAAWHNARDPFRREAYLLGQLKSMEAWRGSLVHQAIHTLVVPCWKNRQSVPWEKVICDARSLAERQFRFSAERRYRESGMSKTKAAGDYCALFPHEFGVSISVEQFASILDSAEKALRNLSLMTDFLGRAEGANYYWPEVAVSAEYNGVRIKGQIDLLFARRYGQYSVVDWKDYETPSSSDARMQMALYAWLLCHDKSWPVTDPSQIELWEVKLAEPSAIHHPVGVALFDELEDFMYRSTDQLRGFCGDGSYERPGDLENFPHTENPNSCRFCSYGNICREPEPWITIASTSMKSKNQGTLPLITA